MEKEEDFYNLLSANLVGFPLVGLTQRISFLNSLLTSNWVVDKVMPRPTDKSGIGAVMGVRPMPYWISGSSANIDDADSRICIHLAP